MNWKRSFREQVIECTKTGNCFVVEDPKSGGRAVIACAPYRSYCISSNCRVHRLDVPEDMNVRSKLSNGNTKKQETIITVKMVLETLERCEFVESLNFNAEAEMIEVQPVDGFKRYEATGMCDISINFRLKRRPVLPVSM